MKKAIALSPIHLKRISGTLPDAYDSIYLGDEFCQNLLPSPKDLASAQKKFSHKVVIATPLLPPSKRHAFKRLIHTVENSSQTFEIVLNGWGALFLIRSKALKNITVSAGRLLSLTLTTMPAHFLRTFLHENNITRMELDQTIHRKSVPSHIKASLLYPYQLLAMTRFYPLTKTFMNPCKHPCANTVTSLSTPFMKKKLYWKGNAYFIANRKPRETSKLSRLMHTYSGEDNHD